MNSLGAALQTNEVTESDAIEVEWDSCGKSTGKLEFENLLLDLRNTPF